MNTIFTRTLLLTSLFVLGGWSIGATAQAAQISFTTTPKAPAAGQEFAIVVWLNTESDSLNAVEGAIQIPSDLVITNVHTGGSGLSLWPIAPHYLPGENSVEFIGGAPTGVAANTEIPLFTLMAKAAAPGSYVLSPGSTNGFRNDGAGTMFLITASPYTVSVATEGASVAPTEADSIAPQFVSVEVGQDLALFGGRAYLTFFATDDKSGVSYYEVKEGWFGKYTKADRYYVLVDQEQGSPIWIRATDASGNRTVEKIPSQQLDYTLVYIGGSILIVLVVAVLAWKLRYRKKRDAYL